VPTRVESTYREIIFSGVVYAINETDERELLDALAHVVTPRGGTVIVDAVTERDDVEDDE
jgi:hypothetical protein